MALKVSILVMQLFYFPFTNSSAWHCISAW